MRMKYWPFNSSKRNSTSFYLRLLVFEMIYFFNFWIYNLSWCFICLLLSNQQNETNFKYFQNFYLSKLLFSIFWYHYICWLFVNCFEKCKPQNSHNYFVLGAKRYLFFDEDVLLYSITHNLNLLKANLSLRWAYLDN
jgi:hypothetical protein